MLYPRSSESREVTSLDGVWMFKADPEDVGLKSRWPCAPLSGAAPMAVPASYNEIDSALRDHTGPVWYEREVAVPAGWAGRSVILRFGAVAHMAKVFWDGRLVAEHKGGFLPFEADVTGMARPGNRHHLSVWCDSRLRWDTLPMGETRKWGPPPHPQGTRKFNAWGDFFNYCGIHRSVFLCGVPRNRILDIVVRPGKSGSTGLLDWKVEAAGAECAQVTVSLLDGGKEVARGAGKSGRLSVPDCRFWRVGHPYLYTLRADVSDASGALIDRYNLPVGIRTVRVGSDGFLVNDEPVFLRGFGRHEDWPLHGRGFDLAGQIRDLRLMQWIGANSYRTAHYPHAEEAIHLADQLGIALVDEVAAVGVRWPKNQEDTEGWANLCAYQMSHVADMRALIERDVNSPSVLVWNMASELDSSNDLLYDYIKPVADVCRELDPGRPVTVAWSGHFNRAAGLLDLVVLPMDCGSQAGKTMREWHEKYGKLILLAESGADAPSFASDDGRAEYIRACVEAAAGLPFLAGTYAWAFADFAGVEEAECVSGSRDGIFTRDRQPKMAAHVLRALWTGTGTAAGLPPRGGAENRGGQAK
jgi:beta-glucuronidase